MRKLVITLFCIALLLPSRGNTLGLGEIELHSSLNEELNADIKLLSVGQESADSVIVQLASREAFARAGIERPFLLNDLRFKVKIGQDGQPYIEVTSKKPIREPFLSFLLEVDWPRGHILREFTMLLDPPVFMQATPEGTPTKAVPAPQSTAPTEILPSAPVQPAFTQPTPAQSFTQAAVPVTPAAQPATTTQRYAQPAVPAYRPADGYRIQAGDTAWTLANNMRPDASVSVEQMMMALLRHNPEVFIKENINGLKRGYILRIPDEQTIRSMDKQQALADFREQNALWREYQQGLTARRTASAIERDGETRDEMAVTERDAEGRLTIASAAEDAGSEGATSGQQDPESELRQLRQELAATTDALESGRLENDELKSRLTALQAQIDKMGRMLELKDVDMAQLQQDIQAEAPITEQPSMAEAEMPEMMAEQPAIGIEEELVAEQPVGAEAIEMSEAEPAPMAEAPTTETMMEGEQPLFTDETMAMPEEAAPVIAPVAPPAAIQPGKPKQKDFITELLEDPTSLSYIAGGLLAILLLIFMIIRRRRAGTEAEEEMAPISIEGADTALEDVADLIAEQGDEFPEPEEDLGEQLKAIAAEEEQMAEPAAMMAEAEEEEPFISLEETPAEEETPRDDVLAEADVYLAYGIYQQAEELLRNAINDNPDRAEYKIKLLETYFAAKDKTNFVSIAKDLQSQVSEESSNWQRVIAMGRELDASNELFSSAELAPGIDVDDLLPKKPETDFDLGDEDMETAPDLDLGDFGDTTATDFDLGLDDEELDATVALKPGEDIDATVALSSEEASAMDLELGEVSADEDLGFGDGGLDELDAELASSGLDELGGLEAESDEEDLDEGFSLDFEMADLGLEVPEETTEEPEAAVAEETPLDLAASTDVDMDLNLGEPESLEADLELGEPESLTADLDMGLDLGEPEALDMDLESAESESLDLGLEAPATEEAALDEIDLGGIDLTAMPEEEPEVAETSFELDTGAPAEPETVEEAEEISGIDLGAEFADMDLDADITTGIDIDDDDEDFDLSSLPSDVDEISTKLDLAQAYIDMGDNDGASSILKEVIEEGDETHKHEAESMLKKIA